MKGENDKSEAAKKSNEFIGERARARTRDNTRWKLLKEQENPTSTTKTDWVLKAKKKEDEQKKLSFLLNC